MLKKIIIAVYIFITLSCGNAFAVILDKAEAEQADLSQLQNESQLFQSIGIGIALSIAQCEGVDLCTLTVDADEVKELIKELDTRIDSLTLRQEQAEDPVGFDSVLTAYINERDNYSSHLEKIESITSTLDEKGDLLEDIEPEADFPVEAARDAELLEYIEDELSVFEDDELVDDEDLEDLPELPEIEDPETTP